MRKIVVILLLIGMCSIGIFAQKSPKKYRIETNLAEFKSDGCSMFPDGSYRICCEAHDLSYFSGGSWTARWRADKELYLCVSRTKGFQHRLIAPVMWLGVRVGGLHFLPTSFRWGFGRKKVKIIDPEIPLLPQINKPLNQSIQ
jgi:hypothetical protein